MNHFNDLVRHVVDAACGVIALGTIAAILPPLAAAVSILWYGIRIYEHYFGKNKGEE